ncbi:adenylate/guanylate cyclase domain-containing protein [Psychrobacter sp. DM4]|uniref:adenylate/guanylate cyclase domain-containing protein n=1 Tax=Psychrobacter sp. DM4 TaxID=3440637 RepID=UPI003F50C9EA
MAIWDLLRPPTLAKDEEIYQFDYPEVFVLLFSVALIALYFNFSPSSMALLVIISLPTLMILVYNYRRQTSFWTSNIVVFLLSVVIGSVQLCTVISLSLALLVGVRIIVSHPENRIKLATVSIVTILIFYYVSVTLNGAGMDCEGSWLPPMILLASSLVMLFQFQYFYRKYITFESSVAQSTKRLTTMVSVINKLTRFVPPQIWQPIVKTDSPVSVSNKRVKLSIMFSDIAGFTELSDSLSADNLADILNTYMYCMTTIASKHGAVLDKFIGDGMVCFFGEPDSRGARQDALDCVAMAVDMRREMRSLRQRWRLLGFDGLDIRIGVTTGYCHVGNFGSSSRLSYTLIGREANLASRLELSANKGEILISQNTYDYICHDYECQFAGDYELKGFDDKVSAWQVLDPDINSGRLSKWIDQTLPGFNLHLNFKDMKDDDYKDIRRGLHLALERMQEEEKNPES